MQSRRYFLQPPDSCYHFRLSRGEDSAVSTAVWLPRHCKNYAMYFVYDFFFLSIFFCGNLMHCFVCNLKGCFFRVLGGLFGVVEFLHRCIYISLLAQLFGVIINDVFFFIGIFLLCCLDLLANFSLNFK